MRYVLFVIADSASLATADEMTSIDAFNDSLTADGCWVTAGGLSEPRRATVVDARGDVPIVLEGPLRDDAEWIAGFWLVDVPDHQTAITVATRGSRACRRKVEVRAYLTGS